MKKRKITKDSLEAFIELCSMQNRTPTEMLDLIEINKNPLEHEKFRNFRKEVESMFIDPNKSLALRDENNTIEISISEKLNNKYLDIKYSIQSSIYRFIKLRKSKGVQRMINELTPDTLKQLMEEKCKYVCSDSIALNIWVALILGKPLLVEGPPGCGKTELAKVLATIFDTDLIRLQCYDGIDENKSLYEWNYPKQILSFQKKDAEETNIFSDEFLLDRPLLKALRAKKTPVLLIDEVDKTDEEFEAFLLEILSDFQVSIPELGTITAAVPPPVVLTSNAIRDLGDALRRRCVYLWIDFPSPDKEAKILMKKTEGLDPRIALEIAKAMNIIRHNVALLKYPSVSESLDVAKTLVLMREKKLSSEVLDQLMTLFIKNKDDLDKMSEKGGASWVIRNI